MLTITLKEGEYFTVGDDIKIFYNRSTGKDSLKLCVDAPRELAVLRGQLYEKEIARRAAEGDADAGEIKQRLIAMHEENDKQYDRRRELRAKHRERVMRGEVAATVPIERAVEREERRIAAREKERRVLTEPS